MKSKSRMAVMLSIAFVAVFGCVQEAGAMHIMEGYLQPKYCIIWGVVCIPFLVMGFLSIKRTLPKQKSTYDFDDGRSLCFCAFCS